MGSGACWDGAALASPGGPAQTRSPALPPARPAIAAPPLPAHLAAELYPRKRGHAPRCVPRRRRSRDVWEARGGGTGRHCSAAPVLAPSAHDGFPRVEWAAAWPRGTGEGVDEARTRPQLLPAARPGAERQPVARQPRRASGEGRGLRRPGMDQYCILGRIGEGAHGIVFKAKHVEVSRHAGRRAGLPSLPAVPGREKDPPTPVFRAHACTAAPASRPRFVVCAHHFGPLQWGSSRLRSDAHPPAMPPQSSRECPGERGVRVSELFAQLCNSWVPGWT